MAASDGYGLRGNIFPI